MSVRRDRRAGAARRHDRRAPRTSSSTTSQALLETLDARRSGSRRVLRLHAGRDRDPRRSRRRSAPASRSRWRRRRRSTTSTSRCRRSRRSSASATSSRTRSRSSRRSSRRRRCRKEAHAKVKKELKKLKMMSPMSAEATVVRNYIDWILSLPWDEQDRGDATTSTRPSKILDEDHYGLEEGRRSASSSTSRCRRSSSKLKGPILCLVGPPGVGKTSLAQVDRARDRPQVRAPVARRRARRGRDPRPPAHVHRRAARQDHPVAEEGRLEQPGVPARRGRQDVDRLPRRPGGGAARGARPRAEPHLQRSLPRSRLRPLAT